MQQHAHSIWSIKSVDAEQRIIEGFASTPELDRSGDSMDPVGAKFTLPMPLLWQHKFDKPLGQVISAKVTDAGIYIRAQIKSGVLPYIEEAWELIRAGLVPGLSIDWKPLAAPSFKNGSARFSSWEWLALSTVTVPANRSTTIRLIKSIDRELLAASGTTPLVSSTPGVTGSLKVTPMNVSEQITEERQALQTKSVRLEELMAAEGNEGGLQASEQTELDGLTKDVTALTSKITRLSTLEAAYAAQAKSVSFAATQEHKSNGGHMGRHEVVDHRATLEKGTLFTRYAMAVAAGKGSISDTIAYAKRWDNQTPEVSRYIKATAGTTLTASPGWGSELVSDRTLVSEFVDLVRAATVLDKLKGLRRVPPRSTIQVQTAGSTFAWVGETGVKPVGELAFETVSIGDHKVAGIVVISEELVRRSEPSAEEAVRRDLIAQCARFIDAQFLTPSVAAGANNPASITNGVASPAASGTDSAAFYVDLNTALATFDNADIGSGSVYIITTPALARGISTLRTSLGQFEFPNLTMMGGNVAGFPVIVSSVVPSGTLILVKADEIFIADEGQVRIDASNQATLDMAGGATPTFNLWQRNCIGLRAEQFITWAKRLDDAVAIIDTATYGPSVGSP